MHQNCFSTMSIWIPDNHAKTILTYLVPSIQTGFLPRLVPYSIYWYICQLLIIWLVIDDRLKEKVLKPWEDALCIHFRVCLYASYKTHLLTYEPNFWDEWSLGHEKKNTLIKIFSLYNTRTFFVSSLGMWYFGWENLVTCKIEDLTFFLNSIFLRLNG